jgi:hypothetical protein
MTEAGASTTIATEGTRKVGAGFAIGIFLLPILLAWFLLRKGYSNTARLVGFGWLVASFLLVIVTGNHSDGAATTTAMPSNASPVAAGAEEAAPEESTRFC